MKERTSRDSSQRLPDYEVLEPLKLLEQAPLVLSPAQLLTLIEAPLEGPKSRVPGLCPLAQACRVAELFLPRHLGNCISSYRSVVSQNAQPLLHVAI